MGLGAKPKEVFQIRSEIAQQKQCSPTPQVQSEANKKLHSRPRMNRWALGAAIAGFLLHHHVRAASAASAGMKVGDNLKDNPEYNRLGSAAAGMPNNRQCCP
jgi:hypothetical protein